MAAAMQALSTLRSDAKSGCASESAPFTDAGAAADVAASRRSSLRTEKEAGRGIKESESDEFVRIAPSFCANALFANRRRYHKDGRTGNEFRESSPNGDTFPVSSQSEPFARYPGLTQVRTTSFWNRADYAQKKSQQSLAH
jgi:hypothetical protein